MEVLQILSGLIAAVIIASVCNKLWLKLPLPFCQIGMGIILWMLPFTLNFVFDPDVFMICIIAPLLFSEGQNVSRRELWQLRVPVLLLALGLVLVTVLAGGVLIHRLIPSMPLGAAFALAAIISPTDLIAVQSMTKGYKLPGSLMEILEGESLLNDAAGIVSFKVALTAVMTGFFSPNQALGQFAVSSLGGIITGLILGFLVIKFRLYLRKKGVEEISMVIVIQIVTPLIVYYAAEEIAVSGILAVVSAGIIHGVERDKLQKTTTKLRAISENTWKVVDYLLNGMVFVLLGYLLPQVFSNAKEQTPEHIGRFLAVLFAIAAILFLVRFLWVLIWHKQFISKKLTRIERRARHFREESKPNPDREDVGRCKYALITAACGAHGTFTLATALSIPFSLTSGVPFPYRNAILLMASGIVLISLACAAVLLPLLLEKQQEAEGLSVALANRSILQSSIEKLGAEKKEAAYLVAHYLKKQLSELELNKGRPRKKVIQGLMNGADRASVEAVRGFLLKEECSDEIKRAVGIFASKSNQARGRFSTWKLICSLKFGRLGRGKKKSREMCRQMPMDSSMQKELDVLHKTASKAAIAYLNKVMTDENRKEALHVLRYYSISLSWMYLAEGKKDEGFRDDLKQYHKLSFQIQRDAVEELFESSAITEETAKELRENLLYEEMQELSSGVTFLK